MAPHGIILGQQGATAYTNHLEAFLSLVCCSVLLFGKIVVWELCIC
jgi:hypothetical protein